MKHSPLDRRTFDRILLVKPSAFGDVLHTVPVLVKLRARYPAACIDWLLTPENAELIRHHPALSGVVLFRRRDYARFGRSWRATAGLLRLFDRIWRARYDLVIDLHGQLRSALFTLASGARVRIGFDSPGKAPAEKTVRPAGPGHRLHGWTGAREGSWLAYSHRLPIPTLDAHAADRYLWLAPLLGLDDSPPDFRVYWPSAAGARVDSLLARLGLWGRTLALVVPGTIWQTKHWRAEGFAEVGRYLVQRGFGVVIAGAARERPRCQEVAAACPGARDLSGQTTLTEFAALMSRAALAVTNDSGSMHLAVAVGTPSVSVFGPTDPVRIGPYGRPDSVVRADVPCSPCYLKKMRHCAHDHACMKQVTAGQVIDRLHGILATLPASRAAGSSTALPGA